MGMFGGSRRKKQEEWGTAFQALSFLVERYQPGRDEQASSVVDQMQALERRSAAELADQAREAFGPDTMQVSASLNLVGYYYEQRGMHEEAARAFTQALDVISRVPDADPSALPSIQNNLANAYMGMRLPAKAEPLLVSAIEGYGRLTGPRSADVAQLMKKLGICLSATGKHDEAIALLDSALEITEEQLGENHEYAEEIRELHARVVVQRSSIVLPEDLSTHEEWRDLARRICRYLDDRWAGRVLGRLPGVVIQGEKMWYFALPGADGTAVAVHELEGSSTDGAASMIVSVDQKPGRLIKELSGVQFPSQG